MRGVLDKGELDTWFIVYVALSNMEVGTIIKEVLLHSSDYSKVSDDMIGKRVEFDLIEECGNYDGKHFGKDCSCKEGFIKYAKLK